MNVIRHSRYYSNVLRLLPRPFREEFGYEMVCDFTDATERAVANGSVLTLALLWVNCLSDLTVNVVVQWLRTGVPMLIGLAMSWTLLLFGLLAIQGIPQDRPESADLHVAWLVGVVMLFAISIAYGRYHTRHH